MSFVLEDLKSYRIAQQLRGVAARHPDEARGLIHAAEWLEDEAKDMLTLCGSVTHNEIRGRITMGCVTTNATSHRGAACGASGGLPGCASNGDTEE